MARAISERIRRVVATLVGDDTPSDEDIREQRRSIDQKAQPRPIVAPAAPQAAPGGSGVMRRQAPGEDKVESTASPSIKPSREQTDTSRKWRIQDDMSRKENRRGYQQQYRLDNPDKG